MEQKLKTNFFKTFCRKYVFTKYFLWQLLIIFAVLLDIFFLKPIYGILILFLIGLWIFLVFYFKIDGRVTVSLAIFYLILCQFLIIFKKEFIAEKAAIWTYLFLLVGIIRLVWENRKEIFSNGLSLDSS